MNKSAAKVQQIFGIHKDLTVKNQIYLSFYRKDLLFSQLCDCTFGGFLIYKGVPTVLQKNDIRKFVCHFFANFSHSRE